MTIRKLSLENFTVFEKVDIDFCDGINIFIGENGTGKTHILKLLNALCYSKDGIRELISLEDFFTGRRLNERESRILFKRDKELDSKITINYNNEDINWINGVSTLSSIDLIIKEMIFIPAKEMLSHSYKLLALERERDIPFDRTLIDIVSKAELGESKKNTEFQKILLSTISKLIEGEVIYENDVFYIKKENGMKVEFSMEAEGIRKFGLIWKLVRNGLLANGTILFWDEPESNINPKLIPNIVEILLELQRNGVQVFLSTHDYILAKYFEVKKTETDKVLFYSLYNSNSGVQCEKNVLFKDLKENPIVKAFDKLLDEVYDKHLGE